MDDIDGPRCPLDDRSPEPLPGLVEDAPRERDVANRHRRGEDRRRGMAMPCRDTHQLDPLMARQRSKEPDGGGRDPSWNNMP